MSKTAYQWSREGITRVGNGAKAMPKGHQNRPNLIQNYEKRNHTVYPRRGSENTLPKRMSPGWKTTVNYYFGGPPETQGSKRRGEKINTATFWSPKWENVFSEGDWGNNCFFTKIQLQNYALGWQKSLKWYLRLGIYTLSHFVQKHRICDEK